MIRSILAIAAGYFSIAALNSFVHLIVSVYFKTGLRLAGISHLPSPVWVAGLTLLQLVLGLFAGLLTTTIAQKDKHIVILGFILLMVIIGFIDYSMLKNKEPIWYLITAPVLHAIGIFTGYKLQLRQV